jgi:hypothetical protein
MSRRNNCRRNVVRVERTGVTFEDLVNGKSLSPFVYSHYRVTHTELKGYDGTRGRCDGRSCFCCPNCQGHDLIWLWHGTRYEKSVSPIIKIDEYIYTCPDCGEIMIVNHMSHAN